MILKEKPKLNEEEREFISLMQNSVIENLLAVKPHLAEEEIAYCLKRVFSMKELEYIIDNI